MPALPEACPRPATAPIRTTRAPSFWCTNWCTPWQLSASLSSSRAHWPRARKSAESLAQSRLVGNRRTQSNRRSLRFARRGPTTFLLLFYCVRRGCPLGCGLSRSSSLPTGAFEPHEFGLSGRWLAALPTSRMYNLSCSDNQGHPR